jgi:hypothetical protein
MDELASSEEWIPPIWWAKDTHVIVLSSHPVSLGQTSLRNLPHKTGAHSLSFFPLAGWAAIETSQAGAASGLSKFKGLWAHCDITNMSFLIGPCAKALPLRTVPLPSTATWVIGSWQGDWISAWLYCSIFPPPHALGGIRMTYLSGFQELPNWNPHFGRQEVLLVVSTNTSQAHCISISQENSFHIGLGNFPLTTTSPITSGYSLRWRQTVPHWEAGCCYYTLLCY